MVTNISNLHTCPVFCVYMLTTMILVTDGQPLQIAGDVIRGSSAQIPIGVNSI